MKKKTYIKPTLVKEQRLSLITASIPSNSPPP
jgi:hypothetical protein